MVTQTDCNNCTSNNVCKYKEVFSAVCQSAYDTPHPGIDIRCTFFHAAAFVKYELADRYEIIREWRQKHPCSTKAECHRDTKISRPTIDKYWESCGLHMQDESP